MGQFFKFLVVFAIATLSAHADFDWKKAQEHYEGIVKTASHFPTREFEKAVKSGDVATVKKLLDGGVPVALQIPTPQEEWEGIPPFQQAIHHAAGSNQLEVVRLLLDRGADANARNSDFSTPLHQSSDPEIAKLLLVHGANVSARDGGGSQPIHAAAFPRYQADDKAAGAKSLELMKLLINHGANPLAKDGNGKEPIHIAAYSSTLEVVKFLLDHGAKPETSAVSNDDHRTNGWQPLHFSASGYGVDPHPDALVISSLLILKGASVNALTHDGETPLLLARNAGITRLLLEHGVKIDVMSSGLVKEQAIHHFAMSGDVESLKLLLDHGADIEAAAPDDECRTPLDTAVFWERKEAITLLLERGAKPSERTMRNVWRFNSNPLEELVRTLHQHGGPVTAKLYLSQPQSHAMLLPMLDQKAKDTLIKGSAKSIANAAENSNIDNIQALIAVGAKLDQPWKGLLPIHYSIGSGKENVVQFFLSAGQAVDAKCTIQNDEALPYADTGVQPIHLAATVHPQLISFLLKHGGKINAKTGNGWQPIHFAAAFGTVACLKAVIEAGGNPVVANRDSLTPLQLAEKHDNKDCANFFKHRK